MAWQDEQWQYRMDLVLRDGPDEDDVPSPNPSYQPKGLVNHLISMWEREPDTDD